MLFHIFFITLSAVECMNITFSNERLCENTFFFENGSNVLSLNKSVEKIRNKRELKFVAKEYMNRNQLFSFRIDNESQTAYMVPCANEELAKNTAVVFENGKFSLLYENDKSQGKLLSKAVDLGYYYLLTWYNELVRVRTLSFDKKLSKRSFLLQNKELIVKEINILVEGHESRILEIRVEKERVVHYFSSEVSDLDFFDDLDFQYKLISKIQKQYKNIRNDNIIQVECDDFPLLELKRRRYFSDPETQKLSHKQYDQVVFLSDIHVHVAFKEYGVKRYLDLLEKLTKCKKVHLGKKKKDELLFVFTGDITDTGTEEEFQLFHYLLKRAGINPSDVIVVPGNHDLMEIQGTGSFSVSRFSLFYKMFYGSKLRLHPKKPNLDKNQIFVYNDILKSSKLSIMSFDSNYKNFTTEIFPKLIKRSEVSFAYGQFYHKSDLIEKLDEVKEGKVIIAMHHHPVTHRGKHEMIGSTKFQSVIKKNFEKVGMIVYGHRHMFNSNGFEINKETKTYTLNLASLHVEEEVDEHVCFYHPADSRNNTLDIFGDYDEL